MFDTKMAFAVLAAAVFLAGCQMSDAPVQNAPAAGPVPVIMPATDRVLREASSSRVTTSADGNTVRTQTRSSSVSVDADALLGALLGTAGPAPVTAAATAAAYEGRWLARQPDGANCALTLDPPRMNGDRPARTSGCFGAPLFSASKWTLRGSELVLLDLMGADLAGLRATGPNRLEGNGLILSRP